MKYDFSHCMDRSRSNGIKYTRRLKLFKTEDVIPMWVADMDIDTPSFVVQAVKKRLEFTNFGYEELPLSTIMSQINWIKRHHGLEFRSEEFLYSHSVVASINVAIEAFSDIGDNIIVQTPVYPPFFKSIVTHDREVLYNPLKRDKDGSYSFDIEDLLSKINNKTKMLLLCSPHNPVGRVWREEELRKLADVCVEHNIVVFADEIHSDLVYDPNIHTPFASLGSDINKLTITAMGVGKTFNMAGFAISSIIISDDNLRKTFKIVYDKIHFAQGASLSHIAMEYAYNHGDQWLKELKEHLVDNLFMLQQVCKKHSDKISLIPPQGTYLAWLDCTGMNLSDSELNNFFIHKAKLGLSSGISFSRDGSGHMRLNFAVSSEIMMRAVNQLDSALVDFK